MRLERLGLSRIHNGRWRRPKPSFARFRDQTTLLGLAVVVAEHGLDQRILKLATSGRVNAAKTSREIQSSIAGSGIGRLNKLVQVSFVA